MEIFNNIHLSTKDYSKVDKPMLKNENNIQLQNQNQDDLLKNKSKEEIKKELEKVVAELNEAMNPLNKDLKFQFNNKVDELVVQVIDKKSDKVIREFPPKEALKLMEKMRELVGLLFDKKG